MPNPAWVQSAQANPAGAAASVAATFGSPVVAGRFLIAVITWGTVTGTPPTFSDSVNGAWTAPVWRFADVPNGQSFAMSYFQNSAAGTPTVTASFQSSSFRAIVVSEYSDVEIANVLDGGPGQPSVPVLEWQAAATSHTSAAIVPRQANDMIVGFTSADTADPGPTITSSDLTIGANEKTTPAVGQQSIAMGHKAGPAANTSVTAAFTYGSSQGGFIGQVALKALARGGSAAWISG